METRLLREIYKMKCAWGFFRTQVKNLMSYTNKNDSLRDMNGEETAGRFCSSCLPILSLKKVPQWDFAHSKIKIFEKTSRFWYNR